MLIAVTHISRQAVAWSFRIPIWKSLETLYLTTQETTLQCLASRNLHSGNPAQNQPVFLYRKNSVSREPTLSFCALKTTLCLHILNNTKTRASLSHTISTAYLISPILVHQPPTIFHPSSSLPFAFFFFPLFFPLFFPAETEGACMSTMTVLR